MSFCLSSFSFMFSTYGSQRCCHPTAVKQPKMCCCHCVQSPRHSCCSSQRYLKFFKHVDGAATVKCGVKFFREIFKSLDVGNTIFTGGEKRKKFEFVHNDVKSTQRLNFSSFLDDEVKKPAKARKWCFYESKPVCLDSFTCSPAYSDIT